MIDLCSVSAIVTSIALLVEWRVIAKDGEEDRGGAMDMEKV